LKNIFLEYVSYTILATSLQYQQIGFFSVELEIKILKKIFKNKKIETMFFITKNTGVVEQLSK
jgi:hypothetical protein